MDLFDVYQQKQIIDQAHHVSLNGEAIIDQRRRTVQDLADVDERIDRLTLLTEAVWSLLLERTDLTEADLIRRVDELDASDGQRDGRRIRGAATCECGAKVNPKAEVCMFCGAVAPDRSGFAAI